MAAGRYYIPFSKLCHLLWNRVRGVSENKDMIEAVLFEVRLPRIAAAALIGGALAVSGASYQGMFRNPVVSPDLLGASAGAGFGAALGLWLGFPVWVVQLLAFAMGLLAVFLTSMVSRLMAKYQENSVMLLVLSGIVISSLFQSFISLIKYVADPFDTLPSISFWLMGGLTYVTSEDLLFLLIPILLGGIPLFLLRWKMNLLSLGDEEAESMGISTSRYRGGMILCSTLMTSACVSIGGMIGWAGLIVPHFARMLVGPNYKKLLPCSFLVGSIFLLFVDDIARCLFPQEIPIGILTSLAGVPIFIYLMTIRKGGGMT
ncbi:MAG TPA: iron ABC transporter permease [Candidatus Merdenecus merdavium]|nr:iron ABC transporter permease [Candidatus Merdenecus merdavium]